MTLIEFINEYETKDKLSVKRMTELFNQLDIADRKGFLCGLEVEEKKEFIKNIRKQAVNDF